MSEAKIRQTALPAGSLAVGSARMRDGRAVILLLLPTGVLIPLVQR